MPSSRRRSGDAHVLIPPPVQPGPLTLEQRKAITELIGDDADESIILAIRDARGRDFQRLEFIGDSLLELLESIDDLRSDGHVPQHRSTTDAALARAARRLGAERWLEWVPSQQRHADLVEAVAGAAYVTGGWPQVGQVFTRVVRDGVDGLAQLIEQPCRPPIDAMPSPDRFDRATATLGASVLEAAATIEVYRAHPLGDAGDLSNARRGLHVTVFVAAWALARGIRHPSGDAAATSDLVETWLGDLTLERGPATSIAEALVVLLEGRRRVGRSQPPADGAPAATDDSPEPNGAAARSRSSARRSPRRSAHREAAADPDPDHPVST